MLRIVVVVVAVGAALTIYLRSRLKQRHWRRHPEERPSRTQRMLRGAPFVVLGLGACAYGFVREDTPLMFEGGGAAILLGWALWRSGAEPR